VGAICKELHVLPRSGGVLDQPDREVRVLEAIFRAYSKYHKREEGRAKARSSNREKHKPQPGRELQEELRGH
jgi:hypothetical protein